MLKTKQVLSVAIGVNILGSIALGLLYPAQAIDWRPVLVAIKQLDNGVLAAASRSPIKAYKGMAKVQMKCLIPSYGGGHKISIPDLNKTFDIPYGAVSSIQDIPCPRRQCSYTYLVDGQQVQTPLIIQNY